MQHADVGHRGAEARSTAIPRVASADDPQEVTMNTSSVRLVATTLAVLACAASCSLRASGPPTPAEVARQVDRLAVPFVANAGQSDPRVAYYASTFSGTVFVTRQGEVVYALPASGQGARGGSRAAENRGAAGPWRKASSTVTRRRSGRTPPQRT